MNIWTCDRWQQSVCVYICVCGVNGFAAINLWGPFAIIKGAHTNNMRRTSSHVTQSTCFATPPPPPPSLRRVDGTELLRTMTTRQTSHRRRVDRRQTRHTERASERCCCWCRSVPVVLLMSTHTYVHACSSASWRNAALCRCTTVIWRRSPINSNTHTHTHVVASDARQHALRAHAVTSCHTRFLTRRYTVTQK